MKNDSPLKKSLNRSQTIAISTGFLVLVMVAWSLLGRRPSTPPAPRPVEIPAVVRENVAPADSESVVSRPAPSTDEQRDQEERLQMLKHSAQQSAHNVGL